MVLESPDTGGAARLETGADGRVLFGLTYHLPAPPDRVWPLLADTERLNRRIGLPAIESTPLAGEPVSATRVRARLGPVRLEYEEDPFQFVEGRHYWVRRRMLGGPLREFNGGVRFAATEQGTAVYVESEFLSANAVGRVLIRAVCRKTHAEFDRAIAGIRRHLAQPEAPPFGVGVDLVPPDQKQKTRERLRGADPELRKHPLAERLFEYVAAAGDVQLAAIRPFTLARLWAADRHEVLALCLRAARTGVLDLYWDLLCPNCRAASDRWTRLEEVRDRAHCDTCQITYDANFDRSVEVTFRPNRAYRHVDVTTFCSGGPMNTPHIVLQWVLAPGQHVALLTDLAPGRYRLRNLPADRAREFYVEPDAAAAEFHAAFTADRLESAPDLDRCRAGAVRWLLENRDSQRQQFILERMASHEEAATAAVVTVHQEFRDLFSSEVLSPAVRLSIRTLPLMFTDLKGSTDLYRELGDATAYALVRDHFELLQHLVARHGGGVVKTIGDAVMAAFPTGREAVACALEIQEALHAFNQGRAAPVRLKMGLHQGPCIAASSYDDRLDYFGSSVNLAARTHGVSTGDDIVLTESLARDAAVQELLKDLTVEPITAHLRGIGDVPLVRIRR